MSVLEVKRFVVAVILAVLVALWVIGEYYLARRSGMGVTQALRAWWRGVLRQSDGIGQDERELARRR